MKILFLTLADIDDRSFGGAMRGNDIRGALMEVGEVHTLVIHGAAAFRLDTQWNAHATMHARFNRSGLSPAALVQRWRICRWVAQILRDHPCDIIVARYLGLALFVPFDAWSRLVLDADDILKTAPQGASGSLAVRAKLLVRNAIARRALRRAGHVWFVNPLDAARLGSMRMSWLANAVVVPPADRPRVPVVPHRLLMVGYFEHPPNAQGLSWFVTHVLPALADRFPGLELHAVGKHGAGFGSGFPAQVHVKGFVADLAAEYDSAALVIAPITSGGGTQIKVIEALAHCRPLVTSSFAHAGFAGEFRHQEHLLVADSAAQWIAQCSHALRDRDSSDAMGLRGHAAVGRAFSVETLSTRVRDTVIALSRATTRLTTIPLDAP